MDRERRIELEIKAATDIAGIFMNEYLKFYGANRNKFMADIPYDSASLAHDIVDHVLRNNRDNLCITEDDLRLEE